MSNVLRFLPEVVPGLLSEEEVTPSRLSAVLEAEYIDQQMDDDGDIYVTEGVDFPLWIHLMSDQKLVKLFTYYSVDEQSEVDWVARVNEINTRIEVPQFCYAQDAVWATYWMTYAGGLNIRQFMKMLRRFSSAVVQADLVQDRTASA